MKRGWFGPKQIGWGASPATWEGWAVTGVFLLSMAVMAYFFQGKSWMWAPMLADIALLLVIINLAYDKNARTGF